MDALGIFILLVNIVLLLLISNKIRRLATLEQQYRKIENNMQKILQENTRIVDVILEELENRINEKRNNEMETEITAAANKKLRPKKFKKQKPPLIEKTVNQNALNITGILDLHRQGLTVQEIAEKLAIPQGEIKLKLNLHEKMSHPVAEKYQQ